MIYLGNWYGHLGLVLSPRCYALLSNAEYNRPMHPGQLVIPAGTTQHMARTIRDQHNEKTRIFREMIGVENALKQQVVAAVESQYIQALRDPVTGRLNGTIAEVIKHLFQVYGSVTPQTLFEQEQKVQQMVYDPQHPIDELVNYSEAAQVPYTQPQCINLGYHILNRSDMFQRWILDWNAKPHIQQNWANFKTHFRKAHQELKETSTLQAQDTTYHANDIKEMIQDLRNEIQSHNVSQSNQESTPPLSSVTDNSSEYSISALQSEVATLKDFINNMQQ